MTFKIRKNAMKSVMEGQMRGHGSSVEGDIISRQDREEIMDFPTLGLIFIKNFSVNGDGVGESPFHAKRFWQE